MDLLNSTTNNMLQEALKYIRKSKSVMPLKKDKTPYLYEWRELQNRVATEEEVKNWWTKWPQANIGLITGKISGVTVIDVDVHKGGSIEGLPMTLIAKTGNGGWHYYYKYQEGLTIGTELRKGVDWRSDGGYVVAPPSITDYLDKQGKKAGGKYEFSWIQEMENYPTHIFPVGKKKADWESILKGVPDGQRNQTAAQVAGKLIGALKKDDWETVAWPMLKNWNLSNTPPDDEKTLRRTFESIRKKHLIGIAQEEKTVDDVEFVSLKTVLMDAIDELQTIDERDILSFGYEWLDEKLTGFFKGELVVLGGETGSGKTTFATNIIYKAGLENHKCAIFALEDRLTDYGIKRLYFEIGRIRKAEGKNNYYWNDYRKGRFKDDPDFLNYLDKAYKNQQSENVYFAKVKKQMDIDLLEKVIIQKQQEGFELFLVDHLHYFDLQKGESSKADYIEQVMVRMKKVLNDTGARMILVVHYKKLEGRKPTLDSFKDSIAIVQNSNYTISLWRDRTLDTANNRSYQTTFFIPKARNPNGEGTIEVTFDPNTNDYVNISKWSYGTQNDNSFKEITNL